MLVVLSVRGVLLRPLRAVEQDRLRPLHDHHADHDDQHVDRYDGQHLHHRHRPGGEGLETTGFSTSLRIFLAW